MRRLTPVDAMLFAAVILWALNVSVSKYMLEHGWHPLAYVTIRYCAAIPLFWVFTYYREGSFRIARSDLKFVLVAASMIFLNQICLGYSLVLAEASTVALLFGTLPIFVAILGLAFGFESLQRSFWAGAGLTVFGVALIALNAGGFSSDWKGIVLGIGSAATWGVYTVAVAPLMSRYSPYRISALVLAIGWVPLALISIPQVRVQQFSFDWKVWLGFAYIVIGPLFLTNILWFTAIGVVGASRAALFNNLQPFFAVLFAVLLLSETIGLLEVVGAALIFGGIALERARRREPAEALAGAGP
jgi:drug/metabolite transporter (DMT)-like permease